MGFAIDCDHKGASSEGHAVADAHGEGVGASVTEVGTVGHAAGGGDVVARCFQSGHCKGDVSMLRGDIDTPKESLAGVWLVDME